MIRGFRELVRALISSRHRERIPRRSGNRLRADFVSICGMECYRTFRWRTMKEPLQIARWQGTRQLHDGKIEIEKGTLVSPGGAYESAARRRWGKCWTSNLAPQAKAAGAGSLVYSITGTVAEPRVALTPTPETQAQLKP
jgi:hypothetical protein